jgi:hypothetical protein
MRSVLVVSCDLLDAYHEGIWLHSSYAYWNCVIFALSSWNCILFNPLFFWVHSFVLSCLQILWARESSNKIATFVRPETYRTIATIANHIGLVHFSRSNSSTINYKHVFRLWSEEFCIHCWSILNSFLTYMLDSENKLSWPLMKLLQVVIYLEKI